MRTHLSISYFVVFVALPLACTAGCRDAAKVGPPGPSVTTGQSHPAPPGPPQPLAANSAEISPELVQKVNDLIRSNKQYIALAETVQTLEDYKAKSDELGRIEDESSSLVEDVMIAEAKLSAAQKAEFTSKYFESLAKPTIELKKQT